MKKSQLAIAFLAAIVVLLVIGCAAPGGQVCTAPPVADEELQLDKESNKLLVDDHVYFSKEGSSGGRSFGSGGCGCN